MKSYIRIKKIKKFYQMIQMIINNHIQILKIQ